MEKTFDATEWIEDKYREAVRNAADEHLDNYSFTDEFVEMVGDYLCYRAEDPLSFFDDLSCGGCSSGMISEFIYYEDTKAFYINHIDDIEAMISVFEDELGDSIKFKGHRWNDAVWFAFEEFSYRVGEVMKDEGYLLDYLKGSIENDLDVVGVVAVYKETEWSECRDVIEEVLPCRVEELSEEDLRESLKDDELEWLHDYLVEELEERGLSIGKGDKTIVPKQSDIVTEAEATLGSDWRQEGLSNDSEQSQSKGLGLR